MTEGNKTFLGLAVPLLGESVIEQQTAATDILSITGATSQTGDFVVLQDVSGNELFVVGAKGEVSLAINSTAATSAITFAMGAGAVVTNFLAVTSTNSPTYFLNVASSGGGIQAAGFVSASKRFISAPSTAIVYGALAMIAGTKAYYIPIVPDTGMA